MTDETLQRGTLTVATRVAQRLAERAALDTAHVAQHSRGLDKITGNSLPHADVAITANRVRAHVTIAVEWPNPAVQVAGEVQRSVVDALTDFGGFVGAVVDVTVAHLSDSTASQRRVL